MEDSLIYLYMLPVAFLVLAALAIFSSLKAIMQRRPQIHSPRFLAATICILFIPIIVHSMALALSTSEIFGLFVWLMPIAYSAIFVVSLIQRRGYTVEGVTDVYFRDALLTSIRSLGLTVEERLSRLKIKETGAELQVSTTSWIGVTQLRPLNKQSRVDVARLINEMDTYFRRNNGAMNYVTPSLQFIAGIFMIVLAVWLTLPLGQA